MTNSDNEQDEPQRCEATTAKGSHCMRYAMPGSTRCAVHEFRVPGRPTKLDQRLQDVIVEAILEGNYRETAAQAAGLSKRTLYNWIARGEEHESEDTPPAKERPFVEFVHALKSAEAHAEMRLLRQASAGGFGWQAQMTVLERKLPYRWSQRGVVRMEHSGPDGGPIQVQAPPDAEERSRRAAALLAEAGGLFDVDGDVEDDEPPALGNGHGSNGHPA